VSAAGRSGGDLASTAHSETDVIVVGSGVAGLAVALGLARTRRVVVLSKGDRGDGSTGWAQGGIAAAVSGDDSPGAHAVDTLTAAAGAADSGAVDVLVQEGPLRLAELIAAGARFDRDGQGRLSVTREGGHHADRVVHAGGDATGAEVSRAMFAAVGRAGVELREQARVVRLLTRAVGHGRVVTGVLVADAGGSLSVVAAPAVVLATGGLGHAYASSTNPSGVTGDGLALALRAGAMLTDMEFVQFHPTALWTGGGATGRVPLISEAVRGAGATLVDVTGHSVMAGVHPLVDLAPRDIVARAITQRLEAAPGGVGDHVLLDATHLGRRAITQRFPTMVAACAGIGIDPATDPVPVAPAEHFLCGGIATDLWGWTGVPGLFAVGEVAATGVHGANRLASNSLLEGLVFGARVAARLTLDLPPRHDPDNASWPGVTTPGVDTDALVNSGAVTDAGKVRAVLSQYAGIRRDPAGLATAVELLGPISPTLSAATADVPSIAGGPGADLSLVALAVVLAAVARRESRGCHWRADVPRPLPGWEKTQVELRLSEQAELNARTATRHPAS